MIQKSIGNWKETMSRIFRYKFSESFSEELHLFAKTHQHDDRVTFKESWEVYIKENEDIIATEIRALQNVNYSGNVLEKMFKSARYYFRTKQKKDPRQRSNYISINQSNINLMDEYLTEDVFRVDFTPKNSFEGFHEKYKDHEMFQLDFDKIKKTYKNRYFILSKNI